MGELQMVASPAANRKSKKKRAQVQYVRYKLKDVKETSASAHKTMHVIITHLFCLFNISTAKFGTTTQRQDKQDIPDLTWYINTITVPTKTLFDSKCEIKRNVALILMYLVSLKAEGGMQTKPARFTFLQLRKHFGANEPELPHLLRTFHEQFTSRLDQKEDEELKEGFEVTIYCELFLLFLDAFTCSIKQKFKEFDETDIGNKLREFLDASKKKQTVAALVALG